MLISKIVSQTRIVPILWIHQEPLYRRLTTGPTVVGRNRFRGAGRRAPRHVLCVILLILSLRTPAAVRKNRYVILPIDFEDAWKVCLSLFGLHHVDGIFVGSLLNSKRSNGRTRLTSFVRFHTLFPPFFILTDHCRSMRELLWLYRVRHTLQLFLRVCLTYLALPGLLYYQLLSEIQKVQNDA